MCIYLVFVRHEEIFVDVPLFGHSILYDCLIRRIYQSEYYLVAFERLTQCRIIIGKARYRPYLAYLILIAGYDLCQQRNDYVTLEKGDVKEHFFVPIIAVIVHIRQDI